MDSTQRSAIQAPGLRRGTLRLAACEAEKRLRGSVQEVSKCGGLVCVPGPKTKTKRACLEKSKDRQMARVSVLVSL